MDSCWRRSERGPQGEHGPPIVLATFCTCGQALPLYAAELPEPAATEEERAAAEAVPVRLGWKCHRCGVFNPCRLGAGVAY